MVLFFAPLFFGEKFPSVEFEEGQKQKLLAGTCQYLVLKIEGKVANLLMMTFTYHSPSYLFYGPVTYSEHKLFSGFCVRRHFR